MTAGEESGDARAAADADEHVGFEVLPHEQARFGLIPGEAQAEGGFDAAGVGALTDAEPGRLGGGVTGVWGAAQGEGAIAGADVIF